VTALAIPACDACSTPLGGPGDKRDLCRECAVAATRSDADICEEMAARALREIWRASFRGAADEAAWWRDERSRWKARAEQRRGEGR
jgi:hypothetical protein